MGGELFSRFGDFGCRVVVGYFLIIFVNGGVFECIFRIGFYGYECVRR